MVPSRSADVGSPGVLLPRRASSPQCKQITPPTPAQICIRYSWARTHGIDTGWEWVCGPVGGGGHRCGFQAEFHGEEPAGFQKEIACDKTRMNIIRLEIRLPTQEEVFLIATDLVIVTSYPLIAEG